jgi:hypothetical protein
MLFVFPKIPVEKFETKRHTRTKGILLFSLWLICQTCTFSAVFAHSKSQELAISSINTSHWTGFDFTIDAKNMDLVASVLIKEGFEDSGPMNSYTEILYYHADENFAFQRPLQIASFSRPNYLEVPAKIIRSPRCLSIIAGATKELVCYESLDNGKTWTQKQSIIPLKNYRISADIQITPFIFNGNLYAFYGISGINFNEQRWMLAKWSRQTDEVSSSEIGQECLKYGICTPAVFFAQECLHIAYINRHEFIDYILVPLLPNQPQKVFSRIYTLPPTASEGSVEALLVDQNNIFILVESSEERSSTDSSDILKSTDSQYKFLSFEKEHPEILKHESLLNLKQDNSQYISSMDSFSLCPCNNQFAKLFWRDMRCSASAKLRSRWPFWVPYYLAGTQVEDWSAMKKTIGTCAFNLCDSQQNNKIDSFGSDVRHLSSSNPVVRYESHKFYALGASNRLHVYEFDE